MAFNTGFTDRFWRLLQAEVFVISRVPFHRQIVVLRDFVLSDLNLFCFLLQLILYKIFATKRYFTDNPSYSLIYVSKVLVYLG